MLNEKEKFLFNFLEIMYKMSKNEVIFFLGSGFSINFKIDNWYEFVIKLLNDLKEEINKPETNFRFMKTTKNVLNDLEIIENKINNNTISLDYALDMIYFCIEFKTEKITDDNKIKADFIKKTYLNHFKIDVEKLEKKKSNTVLLSKIRKKLKKVVTTNYDNLFSYDYRNHLDWKGHFAMPYFDFENLAYLFSKENDCFYLPIHGNVLNDNFQNKEWNIWEKYFQDKDIKKNCQSPVIDSLSTFQKNYIKDKEFLKKFLQNFLLQAAKNNNIVVFFGYSFNDYFVSKEIIDILNELTPLYKEKPQDLIYIVYDDLSDYIMRELKFLKNIPQEKPLLSYEFVKYLNFSTIFLNGKDNNKINKFHENIAEISSIKEKIKIKLSFIDKDEREKIILNATSNMKKNIETKNIAYGVLLNEIKNFYNEYENGVNSFTEPEELIFNKYFFYIHKMAMLHKSSFEIFQDIKNRFTSESENISLYLYAFLKFCFRWKEDKNDMYMEVCALFAAKYNPEDYRQNGFGEIIKLPDIIFLTENYLETLSKEEQKKLLKRWSYNE